MMQTADPTTQLLADASTLIRAGHPIPAAARERIAGWLDSWQDADVDEDGPAPEDFQHAMRIARATLGPEGRR